MARFVYNHLAVNRHKLKHGLIDYYQEDVDPCDCMQGLHKHRKSTLKVESG